MNKKIAFCMIVMVAFLGIATLSFGGVATSEIYNAGGNITNPLAITVITVSEHNHDRDSVDPVFNFKQVYESEMKTGGMDPANYMVIKILYVTTDRMTNFYKIYITPKANIK